MSDRDDIAARLRVLNHHAKKLAENESLHDLHRDALTRCEDLTWEAADEIERLRKERDEARRKICEIESQCICDPPRSPQKYASLFGWDCYKENTDEQ